jgi:DNA repair protein RadC
MTTKIIQDNTTYNTEFDKYSMDELLSMVQEKAQSNSVDRITSASDVYSALAEYSTKTQEHFMLITLDGASKIIEKRVIHIGTANQSLVHPKRGIQACHYRWSCRNYYRP